MHKGLRLLSVVLLIGSLPDASRGYSVLTHEQLIDLTWKDLLQPLLLKRFPQASAADLQAAHAYAYGGSAIQDLGYYPFANQFFSDLTHYVRTGDFILHLLRDAKNVNDYAFALGALSHYVGDNVGHHDAVNPATAIEFPRLGKKYGRSVTYDEDPHAHIRTEFAFDCDQLSKHRLAPGAYLRFIGLRVPSSLLAQAFQETYSLPLRSIVGPQRTTTHSYRTSVRSLLPRFAYAEVVLHRKDFSAETEDAAFQTYLHELADADFEVEWNSYRKKAGIGTHLLAFFIEILPRVGALSDLALKIPGSDTQDLYVKSVNRTIALFGSLVKQLGSGAELTIPDRDLDTGERSKPGAYPRTDQTYARLLHTLVKRDEGPVAADLRNDILNYYSDPSAHPTTQKDPKAWAQVQQDLAALRSQKN